MDENEKSKTISFSLFKKSSVRKELVLFQHRIGSKIVGDYIVTNKIGQGEFASVYVGCHIETQQKVAIKIIQKQKKSTKSAQDLKLLRQEYLFLKLVSPHPNLTNFIDVVETQKELNIILDYVPSPTLDTILENGPLTERVSQSLFASLCLTVLYLHGKGVIHRDLKAENILVKCSGNNLNLNEYFKKSDTHASEEETPRGNCVIEHIDPVICDFGFATTWSPSQRISQACGSVHYAAPEILSRRGYLGPEVDIWSLGVILYASLAGFLPFDAVSEEEIISRILTVKYGFPNEFPYSPRSLLKNIFKTDVIKRYTMKQIFSHSWIKQTEISISDEIFFNSYENIDKILKPNGLQELTTTPTTQSMGPSSLNKKNRSHDEFQHVVNQQHQNDPTILNSQPSNIHTVSSATLNKSKISLSQSEICTPVKLYSSQIIGISRCDSSKEIESSFNSNSEKNKKTDFSNLNLNFNSSTNKSSPPTPNGSENYNHTLRYHTTLTRLTKTRSHSPTRNRTLSSTNINMIGGNINSSPSSSPSPVKKFKPKTKATPILSKQLPAFRSVPQIFRTPPPLTHSIHSTPNTLHNSYSLHSSTYLQPTISSTTNGSTESLDGCAENHLSVEQDGGEQEFSNGNGSTGNSKTTPRKLINLMKKGQLKANSMNVIIRTNY